MRLFLVTGFFLIALYFLSHVKHRRLHRMLATLAGVLAVFWAIYYDAISQWLEGLGTDSLSEAQNFALSEAFFFITTLRSVLRPNLLVISLSSIVIGLLLALIISGLWRRLLRNKAQYGFHPARLILVTGLLLVLVPVSQQLISFPQKIESNDVLFNKVTHNFDKQRNKLINTPTGNHDVRVIVYIGESTTLMHWGLYGYPLNTTPQLDAFKRRHKGLLAFSNIVSTHTHTSLSLLQALSFGLPENNRSKQIYDQKRIPLTAELAKEHIPTMLLSAQSQTGTWKMANDVLFAGIDPKHQHYANKYFESMHKDAPTRRRKDNRVFNDFTQRFDHELPTTPAVAFLHSYAGHGPYREAITKSFATHHEDFWDAASNEQIYGNQVSNPDLHYIADYENAIRYIDSNIASLLEDVSHDPKPTVVVYFSDHGESAITQAGHDSSRLQHEMTRIPFLMYFNQAARQKIPKRYTQFRHAASKDAPGSLEQVPATIMSLLGYATSNTWPEYHGIGLDSQSLLPPIVVRKISSGLTYMRSHGLVKQNRKHATDATLPATEIWLNQRALGHTKLCYDNTNSWSKASRGALVSDCLASKLSAADGIFAISPYLDKNTDPTWTLDAIANIAVSKQRTLWLDATSMEDNAACKHIQQWQQQRDLNQSKKKPLELAVAIAGKRHSLPEACKNLVDKHTHLYQQLPSSIVNERTALKDWANHQERAGWPPNYLVPATISAQSLGILLDDDAAQWAIEAMDVDQLPWQNPDLADFKPPRFIHVRTDWDINTLKDTRLIEQIRETGSPAK